MRILNPKAGLTMLAAAMCIKAAATVAVFPANVVNVLPTQGGVISELMLQTFTQVSGEFPVQYKISSAALDSAKGNYTAAAKACGADEYILLNIIGVDTIFQIEGIRYSAQNGPMYTAHIKAEGMNDVFEALDRLARALCIRKTTDETTTLSNVTKEEEDAEKNRKATERIKSIKFGFTYPIVSGERFDPMAEVGYDMKFDNRNFFANLGVNTLLASNPADHYSFSGMSFTLGGAWHPSNDRTVTPYIGGGMSPRILIVSGEDPGFGLMPYVNFGLIAMRTMKTRFSVDAHVGVDALPVHITDITHTEGIGLSEKTVTDKKGGDYNPVEIGLSMCIGW